MVSCKSSSHLSNCRKGVERLSKVLVPKKLYVSINDCWRFSTCQKTQSGRLIHHWPRSLKKYFQSVKMLIFLKNRHNLMKVVARYVSFIVDSYSRRFEECSIMKYCEKVFQSNFWILTFSSADRTPHIRFVLLWSSKLWWRTSGSKERIIEANWKSWIKVQLQL